MERKLWGLFTGTHLTIIMTAAILAVVPTALWSVDAFTNVAIQDPVSGKKAAVDAARQLLVRDQVAEAKDTPANFVRGIGFLGAGCSNIYTIPAGKALVITSMHALLDKTNTAQAFVEARLWPQANCIGTMMAVAASPQAYESKAIDFGRGIAIKSGSVSISGTNNEGLVLIYGYLVPAGWVP